jgi:glutathione synthase/RimK-type ligase-like ATP-grasp enzyme
MLFCYDEPKGWGQALAFAALKRKMDAKLFRLPSEVDGPGYAFMHVRQHQPELDVDLAFARGVDAGSATLIPSIEQINLYENKAAQAYSFPTFMPDTWVITDQTRAKSLLSLATPPLPFISKAKEGSGSRNVRLVQSHKRARGEIAAAFGEGISIAHGRRQKGYLIWQRFVPGNSGDWRVIRIGQFFMALRRRIRSEKEPFASGSGHSTPVTSLSNDVVEVLDAAWRFFKTFESFTRWCGIDLVRDLGTGRYLVLETTTGWSFDGYVDCRFFRYDRIWTETHRHGRDTWDVLLDEIEAGRFACS